MANNTKLERNTFLKNKFTQSIHSIPTLYQLQSYVT